MPAVVTAILVQTDPMRGLKAAVVAKRREEFGFNELPEKKVHPLVRWNGAMPCLWLFVLTSCGAVCGVLHRNHALSVRCCAARALQIKFLSYFILPMPLMIWIAALVELIKASITGQCSLQFIWAFVCVRRVACDTGGGWTVRSIPAVVTVVCDDYWSVSRCMAAPQQRRRRIVDSQPRAKDERKSE